MLAADSVPVPCWACGGGGAANCLDAQPKQHGARGQADTSCVSRVPHACFTRHVSQTPHDSLRYLYSLVRFGVQYRSMGWPLRRRRPGGTA